MKKCSKALVNRADADNMMPHHAYRLAKQKELGNDKCQDVEVWKPMHSGWDCGLGKSFWRAIWHFLAKLNMFQP